MDRSSASAASDVPLERSDISVIVLSKDEPELEQTLELLEPQCRALDAECVVVDASRGRLDAIRRRHPFVRWIDFVGPLGVGRTIAHQRNAGVRAAGGDIIAFADSGGAPAPDWLAELTAPLQDGRAVAVCGPTHSLHASPYPVSNELDDGARIFRAATCNMAFRRQVFDAIGGFDERFADGEDCDFGWRAEDAGLGFVCASRARMGMDWGDERRNRRRARLYGSSGSRLISAHPKRFVELFRDSPEMFVYPAWEVGLVGAVIATPWLWWAPLAWLSLFLIPVARNVRKPQALLRLQMHLIQGLWFCLGWGTLALDRRIPVVFMPKDGVNPYQQLLTESLGRVGVDIGYLDDGPTPSRTFNRFVAPFRLCGRRLRGTKIVHIHYLYAFAIPWTVRIPIVRRLPRVWLWVWLATARTAGLRIVYTAHDLVQHRKTFDDDRKVQRLVLSRSHAVICMSSAGRDDLLAAFPAVAPADVEVIAEGPPTEVSSSSRRDTRERLGLRDDDVLVVGAGRLERYKGFDLLLDARAESSAGARVAVRLAGLCPDAEYRRVLEAAAARARAAGCDVGLDLRLLPAAELDDLLLAGDIAAFPFRQITNSGSLRRAAVLRLAILIPDLAALRDVPRDAVVRFDPNVAGSLEIALNSLARMSTAERAVMGDRAFEWVQSPSWEEIGVSTREIYDRVLDEGSRRVTPARR